VTTTGRLLSLAILLAAIPAAAQEPDPSDLFDENNSYNMQVACPVWGQDIDRHRLLICLQALTIKTSDAEYRVEKLAKRIDELEQLLMAAGKDLDRLYNWSHCHGTRGECATLADRGR
jgi:hypothetical protein